MSIGMPTVATHLRQNPEQWLTPIGSFLCKFSLDELPTPQKVALDEQYLQQQSLWLDVKIIALTAFKVIKKDGVTD